MGHPATLSLSGVLVCTLPGSQDFGFLFLRLGRVLGYCRAVELQMIGIRFMAEEELLT